MKVSGSFTLQPLYSGEWTQSTHSIEYCVGPRTQKHYGDKSLAPPKNRPQIPRSPISQFNHYTDEVYCGDVGQRRINDMQWEICGCHSSVDQYSSCVGCDVVAASGKRHQLEKVADCIIGLWDFKWSVRHLFNKRRGIKRQKAWIFK
jgi:hypothetical protein